jgi:hypothetical protein
MGMIMSVIKYVANDGIEHEFTTLMPVDEKRFQEDAEYYAKEVAFDYWDINFGHSQTWPIKLKMTLGDITVDHEVFLE